MSRGNQLTSAMGLVFRQRLEIFRTTGTFSNRGIIEAFPLSGGSAVFCCEVAVMHVAHHCSARAQRTLRAAGTVRVRIKW